MTRLSRSSLEPDSWSAAVNKNFSVLVADGRIASVGDFSAPLVSTEVMADAWVVVVVFGVPAIADVVVVVVPFDPNDVDDMSAGATVVGGVKNDPSSRVSRKSLH